MEDQLLKSFGTLTNLNRATQQGDTRYKPFKASKSFDEAEVKRLIVEVFTNWEDLYKAAGFTGAEMEQIILDKLNYNKERKDHVN